MKEGEVGILNVGAGDTKLSFDKANPVERERAAKIVSDMLRRGYAIMIQVGEQEGQPIYRRAHAFDPETCEYVIFGGPDEEIKLSDGTPAPHAKRRGRKPSAHRVPAESTRAVSVSRTGGG